MRARWLASAFRKPISPLNGPAPAALRAALAAANAEIYQTAEARPELKGMGTTAVAFAVTTSHGWLAYVGDSRLYLIRRGQIYRMSEPLDGLRDGASRSSHP